MVRMYSSRGRLARAGESEKGRGLDDYSGHAPEDGVGPCLWVLPNCFRYDYAGS
jgi:hypothetical protein